MGGVIEHVRRHLAGLEGASKLHIAGGRAVNRHVAVSSVRFMASRPCSIMPLIMSATS